MEENYINSFIFSSAFVKLKKCFNSCSNGCSNSCDTYLKCNKPKVKK